MSRVAPPSNRTSSAAIAINPATTAVRRVLRGVPGRVCAGPWAPRAEARARPLSRGRPVARRRDRRPPRRRTASAAPASPAPASPSPAAPSRRSAARASGTARFPTRCRLRDRHRAGAAPSGISAPTSSRELASISPWRSACSAVKNAADVDPPQIARVGILRADQHALQILLHLGRRLVPVLGIGMQGLLADRVQPRGKFGGRRQRRKRQASRQLGDDLHLVHPLPQAPAGQHLDSITTPTANRSARRSTSTSCSCFLGRL